MRDEYDRPIRALAPVKLKCIEERTAVITDVVLVGGAAEELRDV